ncbi:MAG: hypothetical protein WCL46_06230, partial [Chlorobium sp.]
YKLVVRALEIIGVKKNGWCVDFGAGDGYDASNSFNLISDHEFSSVQIEPDEHEFKLLKERYSDNSKVYTIKGYVGLTAEDGLHVKLKQTPCPLDFDFLSIDIDGNDIYAWKAIKEYSSKLVLIEFNPSFPNDIDWRQTCDPNVQQGNSLLATVHVAKELGYELIAVTQINALFVRIEFFHLFNFSDNSIDLLYDNKPYITKIAQLYDGRLVLLGNRRMMWHRVEIEEDAIQVLPKDLQSYDASKIVRKVANKRVMERGEVGCNIAVLPWYI